MDRLRRPGIVLLLVAFAVMVLVVQFTGLTDRPPGYYIDESSFSWNAWTIDMAGVDEHGRSFPLFFEAFGEVRQAISTVKRRGGDHERSVRELEIGPGGVRVGRQLREFNGVLTGRLEYTGGAGPLLGADGKATQS